MAALSAPIAATLWAWTPSGDDVQARVEAIARARGTTVLRPDEVPSQLADAVIAIEDERFYQHHGIDSLGLGRAILYDVTNACLCQGGSTITQQLVKDVYLGGSDRGYNKLEGMVLALKVERILDKRQILALYLSEITTGFGRYGVGAAACAYFHSPLEHLTLGQYAVLAGVTQAPSSTTRPSTRTSLNSGGPRCWPRWCRSTTSRPRRRTRPTPSRCCPTERAASPARPAATSRRSRCSSSPGPA